MEELVALGVIPCEAMAALVPQLTSAVESATAPAPAPARLVDAAHRAFGNRRSRLLRDLSHQVRVSEPPWIEETLPHRAGKEARAAAARDLVTGLGAAVLAHFTGAVVPNPMVGEGRAWRRGGVLGVVRRWTLDVEPINGHLYDVDLICG